MKTFKRFLLEKLSFRVDNPGGHWLADKREYNAKQGKTEHGAPDRFGSVTGYYDRPLLLPVELVAKVKGIKGEQGNVREEDLNWLVKEMGSTGQLPKERGRQYAPFIMVDQDGTPWVNEGNHRIMAAKKLGWDFIPVEIRFFTGGEDEAKEFSPDKLEQYDAKGIAKGYDPLDFKFGDKK